MTPRRRMHSTLGLASQTANAGLGAGERRNSPTVVFSHSTNPPAPDALRPGYDSATENAGWWLAKDAVRPGSKFLGNCQVRETERNVVRPVTTLSATSQVETALEWQASGLSPLDYRSVFILRTGLSSSYAAVVMERPELVIRSNRSVKEQRSR